MIKIWECVGSATASQGVKLGGTVAKVGFLDIGLQGFLTAKYANYTKNKRTDSFCVRFHVFVFFAMKIFSGCVGGAGGHRVAAGVIADGHQVNSAVESSL